MGVVFVLCLCVVCLVILYWTLLAANLLIAAFDSYQRWALFGESQWRGMLIITGMSLLVGIPSILVVFHH